MSNTQLQDWIQDYILGADKAKTTADGRFAVDGERIYKKDHGVI